MNIQEMFLIGMKRNIPELVNMPKGLNLNLGAGRQEIPGAIKLDYPDWDADVDDLPYDDNTVDGIHAYHFLEHCHDPIAVLYDCQRVLKPGGVMNIVVPYYKSQMQYHDLDHKHAFTEETWRNLFACEYYDKNRIEWRFDIRVNIIIGVVERNICLMTQLVKR
jgi:predicted SAM-dependent methyltransferase